MEDLKIIVGRNLSALRKRHKLTQLELAEKMNYTDKAVSKWEQGSTLPDLETLKELCDFYGVTLDYLTDKNNILSPRYDSTKQKVVFVNHIIITCLLGAIVWMGATIAFIYPLIFLHAKSSYWPIFIWAVPASAIVMQFGNFLYFKRKIVTLIAVSILIWSTLTCIFIHFMFFSNQGSNLWPIFILGIPMQVIIVLWFVIRK